MPRSEDIDADETHDPALRAGSPRPTAIRTSRSRTCRSACSAARGADEPFAAASRSATRSWILPPLREAAACWPARRASRGSRLRRACLERASWRWGRRRGRPCGWRCREPCWRGAPAGASAGRLPACRKPRPQYTVPARIGDYTDFYTSASTTRPMSASCSARTIRCCRTTSGCPSATTAAPRPSACRGTAVPRARSARRKRAGRARRPDFGPCQRLDYELELGVWIGAGNALGEPIADRRGRAARVRLLPAQRLVGARHPGLGVPAARPVPVQELRHHDLALDRHARGAGAVPPGVDPRRGRPAAAGLPRFTGQRGSGVRSTSSSRSALETEAMGRERHPAARLSLYQLQARVLDRCADGRPPHRQRLQPPAGRPARQRHAVRPDARPGRLRCSNSPRAASSRFTCRTARRAAFLRTATR